MRLKLLNLPRLLTLTMLLASSVLMTSCASSNKDGTTTTNNKKTILPRPGQARQVAQDTPCPTYIKDANGTLTKINDTAHKGEFIVPDPGPKSANAASSEAIKSTPLPAAEMVPGTLK